MSLARTSLVMCLLLVFGSSCTSQQPAEQQSESFRVFNTGENTTWPLATASSGFISCHWKEFCPGCGKAWTNRPLVLFETQSGLVYGVNGAAMGAGGYSSIETIMVDKRFWPLGPTAVIAEWIKAGLALCDGNGTKALAAISRANTLAAEPLPTGVDTVLSTEPALVNKRRIFFETARCEDQAAVESYKGFDERFDALLFSGRRDEAFALNDQRIKKEDALQAACKKALRQREGLSVEDHNRIVEEGLTKHWPTPD